MVLEGKRTTRYDEGHQNSQVDKLVYDVHRSIVVKDQLLDGKLHIIYTNADCFTNKRSDLKLFLSSLNMKPSVIAITEVNSKVGKHKMQESEFYLDGYTLYSVHVGEEGYRGIILYIDSNLYSSQFECSIAFEECLFVELKIDKTDLLLGSFYRSPNSTEANSKLLIDLINKVNDEHHGKLLLLGDFNFPRINWQNWSVTDNTDQITIETHFIQCLRKNLLCQHVLEPTRARGTNNPHILDLVISSDDFIDEVFNLSPLGKSDHSVLHIQCQLTVVRSNQSATKFNFSKGNYIAFRKHMDRDWAEDFKRFSGNINDAWLFLKSEIHSGMVKFIPLCKSSSWKKNESWKHPISTTLKNLIKKKHRLWTRFQETRNVNVENEYKIVRNIVRNETRKINVNEQRAVATACKTNPKKFWQYVSSRTKSRSTLGNLKVTTDGIESTITDDHDKATAFMQYFSEVYTKESSSEFKPLDNIQSLNMMEPLEISESSIKTKLEALKVEKSPGPDMIHSKVLKELAPQLSKALKYIFDMSLCACDIPDEWKCSTVCTIFKKGSKSSVSNYRPISLTCIVCKILESFIREHILSYFKKNMLFSSYQYGFIPGRSTVLQLITLLDKWTRHLENGGQLDIIYTDFEKAFDKVPHRRLLSKLSSYGIHVQLIKWIENFLCYRKYQVKINTEVSAWADVTSGIPQGSVLGPILFVIYVNDLPQICKNDSELYLFADDAKLYKYIHDITDCTELQDDCQSLYNWCEHWLMSVNINKCKVLTLARSKVFTEYNYGFVNNKFEFQELEHVSSMKDLGIIIDKDLTFKQHAYDKINKAYQMLGIINRNFKELDVESFKILYKSLVRSHLEYGNSVWNPYKKYLIEAIERVQKRASKMVKSVSKLHYRERLIKLKLPTLKFRRTRGDMIEVYKILTDKYDAQATPTLNRCIYNRTRGNSLKLQTDFAKYDVRKYSFCTRVVQLWNSLPDSVVNVGSVNIFKNRLDNHWSDKDVLYDYTSDF